MFVVNTPTKTPGKQQKYRKHHPMEIVPKGLFVNLCVCVQSNKITALSSPTEAVSGLGKKTNDITT
jgi:hypothetical protein